MKKCILITFAVTLVAVLALSGCASQGGGVSAGNAPQEKKPWRITREEGGIAAKNNQVTLRKGENYVYIYFPVAGGEFDSIKLDFTIDRPLDVYWQCVYQVGAVIGSTELIGNIDKGPIETDFTGFDQIWYSYDPNLEGIDKPSVNGMCLKVDDPEGRAVFTLTDVVLVGLEELL